jgi:D-cysteine desulfhydrase
MAASAELSSRLRRRKPPYRIAPGGSSPVGTLGYVSAALELARQVRDGDLPQPGAVFVALGSNGTMAGLVAGMRLAGMDTKIIGVQVSDILRLSPRTVSRLANRTIGLLARVSVELAIDSISPADVTMVDGYLGNGYGHPTDEARHAVELMHRHEGIELEETYTGKTLAAMIDHVEAERPTAPVLFWNTYSSSRPHLPPDADYRDLPQAFHRFFENSDDGAA